MTAAIQEPVNVFGIDISHKPEKVQFAILASGALFCALGFAYLQERVFLVASVMLILNDNAFAAIVAIKSIINAAPKCTCNQTQS